MQAHEQGQPDFEYNQITDHIYLGTNACCVDHFKNELLNIGVKSDISLEKENLDAPYGVEMFLWLPTVDHTPPTPSQLQTGIDAIISLVQQDEKLYVHCKNGHGRAPTLVAAYLIQTGMTADEAVALIKLKRPVIHLEESQLKALHSFETARS